MADDRKTVVQISLMCYDIFEEIEYFWLFELVWALEGRSRGQNSALD